MSKRSSIGSWAYTIGPYADKPIDFDTVCTRLKELGFDGVELGAFPPHPNPGNPGGSDDGWPGAMPGKTERQELVARMRERGLGFGTTLCVPDISGECVCGPKLPKRLAVITGLLVDAAEADHRLDDIVRVAARLRCGDRGQEVLRGLPPVSAVCS